MLLWIGQTVSGSGSWIDFVGLNAYVYHLSGSGKVLGFFLLIRLLPALLFGSLGGIMADRFDRRRILLYCDCARSILVLAFLFTRELYIIYIIGFLLSALDKVFLGSMGAILPDVIEKDEILKANSLRRMSSSLVTVLGPAIGGAIIGLWGFKIVFIIDSCSFFVSVLTLLFIRPPAAAGSPGEKAPDFIEELKVTWKFIAGSFLLSTFIILRLLDALGSGAYNTALPVFASDVSKLGGSFYGYLIAVWGCGTFLGSAAVGFLQRMYKFKVEHLFCSAMLLMAAGMGMTFNLNCWYLSMSAIFLGGLGDGVSGVLFTTMLMEAPPRELRGKVFGTVSAVLFMAAGIGMLLAGLMMDYFRYAHITNTGSLFIFASTLILWMFISRTTDKRQPGSVPESDAERGEIQ